MKNRWSLETLIAANAFGPLGLSFVPEIVRAYGSVEEAHAALVAAAKSGKIELRPESGLGRLSAEEIALCVPGPKGSGSVLSWVRAL